jgi:hypothetical protein
MDMKVSGSCSSRWVPAVFTVMSVLGNVICMFTDDRPKNKTKNHKFRHRRDRPILKSA